MKTFNFVCGSGDIPHDFEDEKTTHLDVQGKDKNVNLNIEHISRTMRGRIQDVLLDVVEVAAYVYCADQRTKRGTEGLGHMGRQWRRRMNFVIPVRRLDVWSSEAVTNALVETLGFLSEDSYSFTFLKAEKPVEERSPHFSFTDESITPDEIALFSGGVDSLAGAVEDLVGRGKKLALVGHHSSTKVSKLQKELVRAFKERGLAQRVFYNSVAVTNSNVTATEYTQRTRSFLFASLAAVIARIYGKNRFTFYENGIISLNLPLSKDAMGARSTRTTHPRVIRGFEEIFSAVLDENIEIDTPLQWLTKKEVTQKLKEYGFENLLGMTSSCTRPHHWSKETRHCGLCSQCIDRRFTIMAAGLEENDPESNYKIDLLCGDRSQDKEIAMAADYVRLAQKVKSLPEDSFAPAFPEVFFAIDHFKGLTSDEAIKNIHDLHKRHADDVLSVIEHGFDTHRTELLEGRLPSGSLLSLCFNRSKIEPVDTPNLQPQLNAFMDRLEAPRCEFAADEENKQILFQGGFALKGADYDLITALLPNFREGKKARREISCIRTPDLAEQLDVEEPSLRKQIDRLRKKVNDRLSVDLGLVMDVDDFIENKQREGYRLSGKLREVASAGDLEENS